MRAWLAETDSKPGVTHVLAFPAEDVRKLLSVIADNEICYICHNDEKLRPYCSRCGGSGKRSISREPMLEVALGQWLHDFGSTNELSQRTRILLKQPHPHPGEGKGERLVLLNRIAELATELCVAVDRAAEDIGGSRPTLVILQELGPLTDKLERTP
jgi:hypothetical protein